MSNKNRDPWHEVGDVHNWLQTPRQEMLGRYHRMFSAILLVAIKDACGMGKGTFRGEANRADGARELQAEAIEWLFDEYGIEPPPFSAEWLAEELCLDLVRARRFVSSWVRQEGYDTGLVGDKHARMGNEELQAMALRVFGPGGWQCDN